MKDLKKQLSTTEQGTSRGEGGGDGARKGILIAAIVLFVLFIMFAIVAVFFLIDKGFSASTQFASQALETTREFTYADSSAYGYSDTDTATATAASGSSGSSGSITAGTVSGTTYSSAFSGISFSAPSSWTVKAGDGDISNPDLEAHNASNTMSAEAQYFDLSGSNYSKASQVVSALKNQVDSDTIVKDNVSVSIGGHKFKGFIFKGTSDGSTVYSEILGADVSGYALVIQIIAPTSSNLTTIVNMFS